MNRRGFLSTLATVPLAAAMHGSGWHVASAGYGVSYLRRDIAAADDEIVEFRTLQNPSLRGLRFSNASTRPDIDKARYFLNLSVWQVVMKDAGYDKAPDWKRSEKGKTL